MPCSGNVLNVKSCYLFFFFTARLLRSNRRTLRDSRMKLKVSVECDVITTGLNKCCLISYPA